MDPVTINLVGGTAGAVLGVLGGVVGTYFSVKNTAGPRERAFMIKAAAVTWGAVTAFLVALWLIPLRYQPLVWLSYWPLVLWGLRAGNRRQEQIRSEEASHT